LSEYATFNFRGHQPLKRVKGARYTNIDDKFRNGMVELVGVDIKLCEYATFNFRGHPHLKRGQRVKGASLTNVNGKLEMSVVKLVGIDTKLERI
jgi:hypothetical protein